MTRLGTGVHVRMFLRSFAVQGSWNYRTLIGGGLGFALLPALRRIHAGRPDRLAEAVGRHSALFNSHPYLATMALGAIATMEAEGEDADVIERFKSAVRGSLGTLGDRLVWAGWRPVCLLLALAALLLGVPGGVAVAGFLILYNAGHVALRAWAFKIGLAEGKRVGERLRRSPVAGWQAPLGVAGAFLVGLALPLAVAGWVFAPVHGPAAGLPLSGRWIALCAAAAVAGLYFGPRARRPLALALGGLALVGILWNELS